MTKPTEVKRKWTGGEWEVLDNLEVLEVVITKKGGPHAIASVTDPLNHMTDITETEAKANANLIAAAPKLFEALVETRKQLFNPLYDIHLPQIDEALSAALGEGE